MITWNTCDYFEYPRLIYYFDDFNWFDDIVGDYFDYIVYAVYGDYVDYVDYFDYAVRLHLLHLLLHLLFMLFTVITLIITITPSGYIYCIYCNYYCISYIVVGVDIPSNCKASAITIRTAEARPRRADERLTSSEITL